MRTSVVIVSCREHPWLGASIDSVRGQTDEVVVVDNGSPGRWASAVARGWGARVVRLGRNRGFPAGVNAGVRAAGGDVIGLLNDDAFAGEGWLASAAAVLADGEVAAVAPKILFAGRDADVVNNAGSYLSQLGYGGDFGFQAADGPAFDVPRECFAACGAAMVFRAETFARVGGFAASFFAYYEDTDWCWRARLAGMSVRYEPAGVVRHVKGVSSGGDDDPKVVFLAARNRLHMLARNAPLAVFRRQVADAWGSWTAERVPAGGPLPPRVAVATRVARGLTERAVLSRRWARSPDEVFRQWAGVGETWDRTGP